MTSRQKWAIAAAGCVVFFAVGRWSTPTKVKIVTQTVQVEKKTDDTKTQAAVDRHKQTIEVTTKKPDGSQTTTVTTTEDDKARRSSDDQSTDDLAKTSTTTKEVTRGSSLVTIGALAGAKLTFGSQAISYGGFVYKPILGPFGVGIFGMSNMTGGIAVGLSF